ncbi:MAG: MerR family transcriptional regulator [Chloroflexi bacterium]|nr:MerR family transcriptional regulator [Chloroflexota bacterium]
MFKIGEFSRIGRVTVETLRHYDALGLLKPAQVDPFTGYRYYSAKQLHALNRIIALKEVGLSLDEVARILRENLTTDELRGILKTHLALTESAIESAQLRREQLQARLHFLNLEDNMPAYEIILKPVNAFTVAAIRQTVPTMEQMPQRCGEMFNMIASWLAGHGLPIGVPLTIYHNESYSRENIDTECAFTIPDTASDKAPVPPTPIIVRQMAACPQMATTIVADEFFQKVEGLTPAYNALAQWIEAHGYHIVGAPRELYYGSPERGDFTAEIQFPVAKE